MSDRNLAAVQAELLAWLLPDVTPADVHRARAIVGVRWQKRWWGSLSGLVRVAYQLGYEVERRPRPGESFGKDLALVRLTFPGTRCCELLAVWPPGVLGREAGEVLLGHPWGDAAQQEPWTWATLAEWKDWAEEPVTLGTVLTVRATEILTEEL